jgi:hypothetical protein
VAYCSPEHELPGLRESASRAGVDLQERAGSLDPARLHVVIQKGRLFQREHPEVTVLVDKGRFLLVDLDPTDAGNFAESDVPCFSIRPLDGLDATGTEGRNRIVFDTRAAPTQRAAPDPVVQRLVGAISRDSYEADLRRLVQLPTRLSTSSHYVSACDFAEQQFASLGYVTSRQAIRVNGSPSHNVVALRSGTSAEPRDIVLVTAHLDSINHEGDAASPAPGADDDGSGSAGAIEIARAFKDHSIAHDLRFVLFGGEEQGLFGSKHHVVSMPPAERARIRAVVNMDMIGTLNTAAPTVLLEGAALSRSTIDAMAAAAATYTGLTVQTSLNAADSDHVSFIRQGIPAVLTIEGGDSSNDEIHTARDVLEHINFDLALEILRMNTAFVAEALGED